MRTVLLFFVVVLLGCGPQSASNKAAVTNVADTSGLEFDENDADPFDERNCFNWFFKTATPVKDSNSLFVAFPGFPRLSLKQMIRDELFNNVRVGLQDLDSDGSHELVIYNYSGGAHCCDEFFVLAPDATGTYNVQTKLFGGNTCISRNYEFSYNLYEGLGYFFACYACLYTDSAKGLILPPPIQYRYEKGRFLLTGDTAAIAAAAFKNLDLLKSAPYQSLENKVDDGVRKMFAINLATLHFLQDGNWDVTRKLFDKYYGYKKDAEEVWQEFRKTLSDIQGMNQLRPQ